MTWYFFNTRHAELSRTLLSYKAARLCEVQKKVRSFVSPTQYLFLYFGFESRGTQRVCWYTLSCTGKLFACLLLILILIVIVIQFVQNIWTSIFPPPLVSFLPSLLPSFLSSFLPSFLPSFFLSFLPSFVEQCCRTMLPNDVVERFRRTMLNDFVERCCRTMLSNSAVERCCRTVLSNNFVEDNVA